MNHHQQSWKKLAAAAGAHRDQRDEAAPYGFAVRVASQACARRGAAGSLLEKFALRGLFAACALGLIATAYGVAGSANDESDLVASDVVGEILDHT